MFFLYHSPNRHWQICPNKNEVDFYLTLQELLHLKILLEQYHAQKKIIHRNLFYIFLERNLHQTLIIHWPENEHSPQDPFYARLSLKEAEALLKSQNNGQTEYQPEP